MKIVSVGAGPAALYFGLLMKKAFQDADITLLERNRADDTFGWGVVFSEETLGNLERADPESMASIRERFRFWGDIETYVRGTTVRSSGHGFCGLSRQTLLHILQTRCREVGVKLAFEQDVQDVAKLAKDADLVLGADGVNSLVRAAYADHFKPTTDWGKCKFCWLGTDKTLAAFTFIFEENEHGLFQVHAYPFEEGRSTFIVECRQEVWQRAGLETATEADTVRYCEKLFEKHLGGHRLLTNRSQWRTFPTIKTAHWSYENIVLLGDAAHTAHFSIGSGTKLAMEDAIALAETFTKLGTGDVPQVLATYQESRQSEVIRTQRVAETSLEWFENAARYQDQEPDRFNFNLMTRSKRITYDNLKLRDPALGRRIDNLVSQVPAETETAPPPIFTPFKLRGLELHNRIVVSPMCQYSATDGLAGEWHLVHLGSRAVGGAALVISEMTDVSAEGRITHGCAGLWNGAHQSAWQRIVKFVHENSAAKIGVQLAHAGRKASCRKPWEGGKPLTAEEGAWPIIGPSALPFDEGHPVPREMNRGDMDRLVGAFTDAAKRSLAAGFDLIELHMAHGYLLSSFLSPLSNKRTDEYGGSLENRARLPLEILDAVRLAWPGDKPISVRISASDWVPEGGMTVDDAVKISRLLKEHGADIIDVSSAGNSPESKVVYGRMYQVPFSERIRHEAEVPTIAVGAIEGADHANTIIAAGRADLCALARPHLLDPYLTLHAAVQYGVENHPWPNQYLMARPPKRPTA